MRFGVCPRSRASRAREIDERGGRRIRRAQVPHVGQRQVEVAEVSEAERRDGRHHATGPSHERIIASAGGSSGSRDRRHDESDAFPQAGKHIDEGVRAEQVQAAAKEIADARLRHPEQFCRIRLLEPPASSAVCTSIIRSARIRRCSASSRPKPRSRNTLPLERVILSLLLRGMACSRCLHERPESRSGDLDVASGDPRRLLLEGVHDVHGLLEGRHVENAVLESRPHPEFADTRANGSHRFPVVRVQSLLNPAKLEAGRRRASAGNALRSARAGQASGVPSRRYTRFSICERRARDKRLPPKARSPGAATGAAFGRLPRDDDLEPLAGTRLIVDGVIVHDGERRRLHDAGARPARQSTATCLPRAQRTGRRGSGGCSRPLRR